MKFMEKAKRFFTLKRRANDGFTLVELIVVIAILAILAGVAVPAYSGYIEKSKRAGDETLLAAVNKAFASACLDQGTEIYLLNPSTHGQPAVTITDGAVTAVTPFGEAFKLYYAGNESAKFQTITSLVFDWGTYMFVDPANTPGGQLTVSFGGNTISVSAEAIKNMQNSTYGQTIGGAALLNEVASLTDMIGGGDIDADALLADKAYMASFATYLGFTGDTSNPNAVNQYVFEHTTGLEGDDKWTEGELANAMVNGLVYYAAEGAKNMTTEEIDALFTGNIAGNLSTNQGEKLAQASMVFGMYTGFVNSKYNTTNATNASGNPMDAIRAVSGTDQVSQDFQKYLASAEGKADMQAYQSAMDVINGSTGNAATGDVLKGGFDNAELQGLLTQVLGK